MNATDQTIVSIFENNHQGILTAQIPLTFSCHQSLLAIPFGKSSSVHTELTDVNFCWLAHTGVSMFRNLSENITYEFVSTLPASLVCLGYFVWVELSDHATAVL